MFRTWIEHVGPMKTDGTRLGAELRPAAAVKLLTGDQSQPQEPNRVSEQRLDRVELSSGAVGAKQESPPV